jgi:phosphoribosylformylglycinamidine cyclo-ligase
MGLTYRDAGVDIDKGDAFVDLVRDKLSSQEQKNIGLFGGLFDLASQQYTRPMLVASTDGVGTKLLLAKIARRYDTIGIDLVAMCVNDVITSGAKPLFFLDYLATGALELETAARVLDGIVEGCRRAGCVLLGGETAEMPGVYGRGDYELAGFTVGIVEADRVIDGATIERGDQIIGLRSSGIHSNGLSLARKALELSGIDLHKPMPPLERPVIDELLVPTKIYVAPVLQLLERFRPRGIAHITGGGLYGNAKRVLPRGMDIRIDWERIKPHPVFTLIQRTGGIETEEMRRTFNMGIGLVLIMAGKEVEGALSFLKTCGEEPHVIGEVF